MKDSCDASLAKLERDFVSDHSSGDGFPNLSRGGGVNNNNNDADKFDLRQYLTTPFPSPSFTRLRDQQNTENLKISKIAKNDFNVNQETSKPTQYVVSVK